jgi:DNA replication protein DnaC
MVVESGVVPTSSDLHALVDRLRKGESETLDAVGDPLLRYRGRTIRANTEGQQRYVDAIRRNTVTFGIGPAGTGKTHLAKAFGYESCNHGLRTYFIKMSELRDRFTAARRTGKTASVLNSLVRPSCLIIDEVGHCEFDKENTRLFFDLVDRRYNKEGSYNIVFTSNKNPSEWRGNFNEDDALLCALDRIFDTATVITIKGNSFRGSNCETISVQTTRVNAPTPTVIPPR